MPKAKNGKSQEKGQKTKDQASVSKLPKVKRTVKKRNIDSSQEQSQDSSKVNEALQIQPVASKRQKNDKINKAKTKTQITFTEDDNRMKMSAQKRKMNSGVIIHLTKKLMS